MGRLTRIMKTLQQRGIEERVKQIVDEVFLPHFGKLITAEMVADLEDRMRSFLEHLMTPSPQPSGSVSGE